jgi:uncharacterized membrane protein
MNPPLDFWPLLIAMTVASFATRAAGFWLMRFVTITPRLEAALKATPLAVMVGIATPAAASGKPAEILGIVVTIGLMRATGNDLVAAIGGVAALALARQFVI